MRELKTQAQSIQEEDKFTLYGDSTLWECTAVYADIANSDELVVLRAALDEGTER